MAIYAPVVANLSMVNQGMKKPDLLRSGFDAERQGFEPWQRFPVDRLAICSITTLAPLLWAPF